MLPARSAMIALDGGTCRSSKYPAGKARIMCTELNDGKWGETLLDLHSEPSNPASSPGKLCGPLFSTYDRLDHSWYAARLSLLRMSVA